MKYFVLSLSVFFLSCESCSRGFYGTNSHDYLDISYKKSKINGTFFEYFIDSVLNKNVVFPDSIKSRFYVSDVQRDLFSNQRLVHFENPPQEWYLVGLEINPCWIEAVYSPALRDIAIYRRDQLKKNEIDRIEARFKLQILDSAETYAKRNHIPDSVVYIR